MKRKHAAHDHNSCVECGLNHETHNWESIEWHCKNPCQFCNWSLEFKHENFCPIVLEASPIYKAAMTPTCSGEYLRGDATGEFDMETYAYAYEFIKRLHLTCLWKIEARPKGVMLFLHKSGNADPVYIESKKALDLWGASLQELTG